MGMNLSEARMVDPILTTHAQGYKRPDDIGHVLFPRVSVNQRGGQIIEFGKEAFRKYNARRSPGGNKKRIEFGYAGKPFALVQDALEGKVPFEIMEDAKTVPGNDLGKRAVNTVSSVLANLLEIEQGEMAMNAANYDASNKKILSGSDKWADKDNSDPIGDIDEAKEAVRKEVGVEPNTIVFSAKKWKEFKNHPAVIANFVNKSGVKPVVTTEMAAELLEVETVAIGKGVYADDQGVMQDIWGNGVVVAYVAKHSGGAEEPSYGYTYTLNGNPHVSKPYVENNADSWIYPVKYERVPVMSGMKAGYLITE